MDSHSNKQPTLKNFLERGRKRLRLKPRAYPQLAKQVFKTTAEEVLDIPLQRSSKSPSTNVRIFRQQRILDRHFAEHTLDDTSQQTIKQQDTWAHYSQEQEASTLIPSSSSRKNLKKAVSWHEKSHSSRIEDQPTKLLTRDNPLASIRFQRHLRDKSEGSFVRQWFEAPKPRTPAVSGSPGLSVSARKLIKSRTQSPLISRQFPQTFRLSQKKVPNRPLTPTFNETFNPKALYNPRPSLGSKMRSELRSKTSSASVLPEV
jgi:hypothetical protein